MSTAAPVRTSALAAGRSLGRFRIVRLIGRGATGAVYLAADDARQLAVALKVVPATHGAQGDSAMLASARFLQGAAAARQLVHADIAQVYEGGEQGGWLWLAMELLPGCELGRYTQAARLLPELLCLDIVERLALALAHAHECGVVHRDVKPGNVMVDLPNGGVKLTDFGLAVGQDPVRTRTGVVLGSPAYMAPEQLAGAPPDASGDLYALGVVLFQLLCGRLPHDHPSLGELLRQVASVPAPDLRQYRPDLPAALAAVVARTLSKQAAPRPTSGRELAAALAQIRATLAPAGA